MSSIKISRFIACGLLILAIADLPYGYYQFLRIVISIIAGINVLGEEALDMGKNRKNIEQILSSTSRILPNSQQKTEVTDSENSTSTLLSTTLSASGDFLLFYNPTPIPITIEITVLED